MIAPHMVAWMAGLLEGEGCFTVTRRHYKGREGLPSVRVQLKMTDYDIMLRFGDLVGKAPYQRKSHTEMFTRDNRPLLPIYDVTVYGKAAVDLMQLVRPYMGVRRQGRIDQLTAAYFANRPWLAGEDVPTRSETEVQPSKPELANV